MPDIVQGDDIRVLQPADDTGFAGERADRVRGAGCEQLDRDLAFEFGILGQQDNALTAFAKQAGDAVTPDSFRQDGLLADRHRCTEGGESPYFGGGVRLL